MNPPDVAVKGVPSADATTMVGAVVDPGTPPGDLQPGQVLTIP